jgi:hypothetical protein
MIGGAAKTSDESRKKAGMQKAILRRMRLTGISRKFR